MIKVLSFRLKLSFGPFTILLVEGFSEMGHFRHLANHVLGAHNFGNISAMRVTFFFENVQNLILIPKLKKKNFLKEFFVSEIIGSELVTLNCHC